MMRLMVSCKESSAQLSQGTLTDPHCLLGLHEEGRRIRLWRPGEESASLIVRGKVCSLQKVEEGLFEYGLDEALTNLDYQVTYSSGLTSYDPYAFLPTWTREDERLFKRGRHERIYEVMGGRLTSHQGAVGVKFALWAPCAKGALLVGDFNGWNPKINPMRQLGDSGVFELFVPGLGEGERYKFVLLTAEGHLRYKADPYGFQGDPRPQTASVICSVNSHQWRDEEWIEKRVSQNSESCPLNIYEIHLGSWQKNGDEFANYRDLASPIAQYCQDMGYTHVELMPVMGHPLDESWGYQVTGFYALSQRYGTVADFQFFVDDLHQKGIGVILDWVPGHFPIDEHSLAQFDGTSLYEHCDPRQGYHPDWKTHIFNFGRYEVANFLIGSALFYLEVMHVDGLRVDAVSSMVYLDFGRKKGEWIPNIKGGNENLEAIAFLVELNCQVHKKCPGVLMIAEESHAYPGVTDQKGLGFDLKWAMGWMNDTLDFFQVELPHRSKHAQGLLHTFTYCFTEKCVLPLSHDEVVHEKRSLLSKMPGNEWEKFANVRLLLSYMICYPGKKLLFMGGEFGQWHEWDCKSEIHWDLLQVPYHQQLQRCVRDLNHFYLAHRAFWEMDFSEEGFEWVHRQGDLFSYLRKGKKETLLCLHNFSGKKRSDLFLPIKGIKGVEEVLNTDGREYGGYGTINEKIPLEKGRISLTVAPLSTLILACS